ncbi:MAG: hypothetical protein IKA54_04830 [Clostridia bacterium]|nr:hypothetical protein [Clostridia bacterium]
MPGVSGAVKLNSKVIAPISKNTETETSVSAFDLPSENVVSKVAVEIEEPIETTETIEETIVEETIQDEIEHQVQQTAEEVVECEVVSLPVYDIKLEFEKPVKIIKTLYDKVFSKSSGFKPEYAETVGDLIFYLSYKLKSISASLEFDKAFSIKDYKLPSKYQSGYIPLALKLALWCEQKGLLSVSDDLLYEISSVYLKSASSASVSVSEEMLASIFFQEYEYLFRK